MPSGRHRLSDIVYVHCNNAVNIGGNRLNQTQIRLLLSRGNNNNNNNNDNNNNNNNNNLWFWYLEYIIVTVIKIVSNNLCLELNRGVEFNRYVLLDGSVFHVAALPG